LVDFMLQRLAGEKKIRARKVSPEALAALCAYPWPGNVRELENTVYRSGVVAQGETVLLKDLPREIGGSSSGGSMVPWPGAAKAAETATASKVEVSASAAAVTSAQSLPETYDLLYRLVRAAAENGILEKIEMAMIERALKETDGNHAKAADLLGITRATLKKRVDAQKE